MGEFDATQRPRTGPQVIEGYGDGRFRVSGAVHEGSVVVFRERTVAWPVEAITVDAFDLVVGADATTEILIVGCGAEFGPPPEGLAQALRAHGIALEWMDTGAACRTYNVLVGDDRAVTAALIAVE